MTMDGSADGSPQAVNCIAKEGGGYSNVFKMTGKIHIFDLRKEWVQ
jgi:hypothetical protein